MSTALRFRKKPVEVEAMRFDGKNWQEVADWCGGRPYSLGPNNDSVYLDIKTLEGTMTAFMGDWVVKGTRGEFYPVKPEPFEDTFEPVGVSV